ncbi:MAG: lipid II flippase MurJ [Patescibacteria group bacterium]|nr:polysaccharide biosynthesis C-terminal domain-containing protein [Patescibacteria group bacterium]
MTLNKKIALDSIKTTSVTFLVQTGSFVISAIIAAFYGATGNTDSYFYALSLVLIFTTGTTGILKAVFIPVFLRFKKESPNEEKDILGSFYSAFGVFLFGLWGIFILISVLLTFVFKLHLGGMEPLLLGKLLLQMSFLIILTGFVECYSTIYNAYQHFVIPLITPLIRSFVFIGFVFATRSFLGVQSLSIGNVLGEFIQLFLLLIALYRAGISLSFSFRIHKAVKRMIKIAFPPFLSNAMTRVNNLVDGTFIAPLLVGGVTILNYSSKIAGIPEMLLTGAFLTVILSYWSLSRVEEGMNKVADSLKKVFLVLGFIFIPLLFFMYFLRLPLVQLMYERKNFTYELSVNTARFLGVYLIGILPLILGRVLTRAFLVIEDTWTPFWVGNFRFVLNIVANLILIKFLGFIGIPISTTITSFAMFFYMYFALRKKIKLIGELSIVNDYAKMLGAGLVSGYIVKLLYGYIVGVIGLEFMEHLLSLGLSCFIGVVIYIIFNLILKSKAVILLRELKK